MRGEPDLRRLSASEFGHALPALVQVYAAAMSPPADQLPGRHSIMAHHATFTDFVAVAAVRPRRGDAVAFAYGFPGHRGQWWHDVVTTAVRDHDPVQEERWFSHCFEVAEVHVHPRWQGRGIGRALLRRLTAERPESTAVLSTHSGRSRARALYESFGFVEVLPRFHFPGATGQPFSIMAAPLPLRESPAAAARSPGRR